MFDWISKMESDQEPMSLFPPGYIKDLAKTLDEFFGGLKTADWAFKMGLTKELMRILVESELKGL